MAGLSFERVQARNTRHVLLGAVYFCQVWNSTREDWCLQALFFFPYYLYSCAFRIGWWHLSLSSGSPAESRVYKSLINTWGGDQILKFCIYYWTYKALTAWINIPFVEQPGVTRMRHFSRSVTRKCWHLAEAKCKWDNHKYLIYFIYIYQSLEHVEKIPSYSWMLWGEDEEL